MRKVVGIGEYYISDNTEESIITYALGSCVAVTAYCAAKRVLGMAHILLPDSSIDSKKSILTPGRYADTAVPLLINTICSQFGSLKEELIVNIFGGAQTVLKKDIFLVGKKNIEAVKRILKDSDITCNIVETGGTFSRTLEVDVATGTPKLDSKPINLAYYSDTFA